MHFPRLSELPKPPAGKIGWPWEVESAPLPETLPDGSSWPRISIVTPSYNQGQFIEATIRSVLLQGYPNLEYIIIDGGSSDNSVEVIKQYGRFITNWVSEKDKGHGNALNKGFAKATGDIMAWLNSDDIYLPNAFRNIAEVFVAFPELEWATTAFPGGCGDTEQVSSGFHPGFSRKFFFVGGYMGFSYSTAWIQQESTFWKRSLWLKAGGTISEAMSLALDFELWSRYFRFTKIATIEEMLGCFRTHRSQRSTKLPQIYREEAMRSIALNKPLNLEIIASLYHAFKLNRLVRWRRIANLLYGERVPVISRKDGKAWAKKDKWVA